MVNAVKPIKIFLIFRIVNGIVILIQNCYEYSKRESAKEFGSAVADKGATKTATECEEGAKASSE